MRRALVLTNEAARHPFRQQTVLKDEIRPAAPRRYSDAGFFLVSFVAGFIVIFGMIA